MTRVVSVGRSKGIFVFGTGIALLVFAMTGCPGTLDPKEFPAPVTGTAGTTGVAGTGVGGTTGTGGAGCATIQKVWDDHFCSIGGCHDAASPTNFKMAPAGWEANLVGKTPMGGGTSMCGGNTMAYIIKGPAPVGGLLLNKLKNKTPACGAQMPNLPPVLNATELDCVQKWADQLGAP